LFFVEHALQHSVIILSVMLYNELIEPFISFSFVWYKWSLLCL